VPWCGVRAIHVSCRQLFLFTNQLSGSIPSTLGNRATPTYVWFQIRMSRRVCLSVSGRCVGHVWRCLPRLLAAWWLVPSSSSTVCVAAVVGVAVVGALTAAMSLGGLHSLVGVLVPMSCRDLRLHNNSLSGSIPLTLGNLTALRCVYRQTFVCRLVCFAA
jgi:hypothetical protein